jgi:ParB-like chromosome segregation protein Spo0J
VGLDIKVEVGEELIGVTQTIRVNKRLLAAANEDIENIPFHRDHVDKLIASFQKHGYRPEMADHQIEILKFGRSIAVLEGNHRVVAAYYAGVKELKAEVIGVSRAQWRKHTGG